MKIDPPRPCCPWQQPGGANLFSITKIMPNLEELLAQHHFTQSEIIFTKSISDWILQINLNEKRGVKFKEIQNHFGKVVYPEQFIKDTLQKLTTTTPQILCYSNGWRSVTVYM